MVLVQSPAVAQSSPSPQVPQSPPPQSMSVSALFIKPSSHSVATQRLLVLQMVLVQSAPVAQTWPSAQSPQSGPPQSTPVSLPFDTVSEQVGAWHVVLQTPLTQSVLPSHAWP